MSAPSLPKSLLSMSRAEYYDADGRKPEEQALKLTVKERLTDKLVELPEDLRGSFYLVAPAGSVDSPTVDDYGTILPSQNGEMHLLNGDGMVCRIDFSEEGAKFSSRFVKTAIFYADQLAKKQYPLLKFLSYGISRQSWSVGSGDQCNTAFLPFTSEKEEVKRMLVTWDMGRPVEIDPATLQTIAPVGHSSDWRPMMKMMVDKVVNKTIMTSAHSVVVPNTSEVISVNVVKSIRGLLGFSRLFPRNIAVFATNLSVSSLRRKLFKSFVRLIQKPVDSFVGFGQFWGQVAREELFLVRWNGDTEKFDSWKVILPNGDSIQIEQTTHQMGITEDYILVADTAFKITIEDVFPSLLWVDGLTKFEEGLLKWLQFQRGYSTYPLLKNTTLYLIRRDQLNDIAPGEKIVATKVELQDATIAHYEVDYDNSDDKITLHAALIQSTDFAEFIHKDDDSVFKKPDIQVKLEGMAGMFSGAMEVNQPASYVINAKSGKVESKATLTPKDAQLQTWSMGTSTFQHKMPSNRHEDIFWNNFGAWPELISDFLIDLYDDAYKDNPQALEEFLKTVETGLPPSLCRIHIDRSKGKPEISVADSYQFPANDDVVYFGKAPQFLSKPNASGSTDGYILVPVNYSDEPCSSKFETIPESSWSDNTELWIFDAANLGQGPLYRLSHAYLNLGLTIHTASLEKVMPLQNPRHYDVRQDYQQSVATAVQKRSKTDPVEAQQLAELFEEVYVQVERDQGKTAS